MPDYSIVIISPPAPTVNEKGQTVNYPRTVLVNGVAAYYNDYDYIDDDWHRQRAMEACDRLLEGRDPFASNFTGMKMCPLSEMAQHMHRNVWWMFMREPEPVVLPDDYLEVSVDCGRAILTLNQPGEQF
jgi:hypothetical protein